jgi:hypothetical protein
MVLEPSDYLNYGALGASMMVLLIAVAVLYRVLLFVGQILSLVLNRFEDNTAALVQLAERLNQRKEEH